jgi:hypothetical protein
MPLTQCSLCTRHPTSRPATVKEIKERGIEAYPELLPADKRDKRDINDLEVIEECVGLRPTRKGGIRLETTTLSRPILAFPVVFRSLNFRRGRQYCSDYTQLWVSAELLLLTATELKLSRHGGAGYQASWGSARRAVDLLKSMVK